MFLKLKSSEVSLDGISLEMCIASMVVMQVYKAQGMRTVTITSARDGKHSKNSLHYQGKAIDFRIWSLPDVVGARDEIQMLLGHEYDVILEKDHIHVEYDPAY